MKEKRVKFVLKEEVFQANRDYFKLTNLVMKMVDQTRYNYKYFLVTMYDFQSQIIEVLLIND